MFNCFLSLFVSVLVPDAYVKVLSIIVFFSINFSLFDMFLFLKYMNNKYCINIYLSVLNLFLDHNFKYVTAALNSSTSGFEFSGMWHGFVR